MATMSNFPTLGMTYDQNPYSGGITYDQIPYPGDGAHDHNPVVIPTPPPPLGLNIDRCIIVVVRNANDIVTRVTELFIFNSDC